MKIGEDDFEALVDTGASISVINEAVVKKLQKGVHKRGQCPPLEVSLSVDGGNVCANWSKLCLE